MYGSQHSNLVGVQQSTERTYSSTGADPAYGNHVRVQQYRLYDTIDEAPTNKQTNKLPSRVRGSRFIFAAKCGAKVVQQAVPSARWSVKKMFRDHCRSSKTPEVQGVRPTPGEQLGLPAPTSCDQAAPGSSQPSSVRWGRRGDGYDCVALNTVIYGRLPKQHRCTVERIHFDPTALSTVGRRRRKASFREPSLLRATASRSGGGVGAPGHGATAETGPDQVTRLTVVLENPADAQVLTAGSEALQSYDIVAAVPCCQRSFEVLCKDSDVDIVSLPSGKRLPFTINKKNADAALARGAVFEVTYSQAIQSSSARRCFIGNCRALVTFSKGRGIILASGAESWLHSRTPHDVANLGQLLGLSQEQSLRAVSDTPLAVLRRAEARKSRFRGLAIGGGSTDAAAKACLLESLQVPEEFYLPEAVAIAGPKRGTGVHTPAAGVKDAAVADEEQEGDDPDDDDDDGGFLSFGTAGDMDVDS